MNKMVVGVMAIFLVLLLHPAVAGTLVLEENTVVNKLYMMPYIDEYRGATALQGMQAVRENNDSYVHIGRSSPVGFMEHNWLRFSVRNNSSRSRSLVLDFEQALFSRIEWDARSESTAKYVLTGQNYPYATRDIDYAFFAFQLDIPPGETMTVNFAITTPYATLFLPHLSDSGKFAGNAMRAGRIMGSVVGMLLAACIVLSIYVARIRKFGLIHIMLGFSICCLLSAIYINGGLQRVVPGHLSVSADIAYLLIHCMQGFFFCALMRGFYHLQNHGSVMGKFLLSLMAAELMILLFIPFSESAYLVEITLALNTLIMLLSVPMSIFSFIQKRRGAYLFSTGLLGFILMAMISSLGSFGILPVSYITRYGYEFGLTFQIDFLALAIVSQIFSAERERVAMQVEVLRLEADMQARSEFVDRVTHDIKSPLSAVLGAAQLLRDKYHQKEAESYLGIIQRSCEVVISIIDDILGHSRMKANQMTLRIKSFSLPDLLTDIEASIKASQQNSGVSFLMTVDPDIPTFVEGDKLRVSQLLINLLTNAFKFTDEGRVSLTVDLVEKTASRILVRFVIQDTGIGMSEGFLQKAFEPYAREEHEGNYRSGFGLGLAICKQIVDLMGGSIDVLSAVGQGSRFTLALPFAIPE